MSDVDGRGDSGLVVLITGASRGIGAQTARQLSTQAGARIAVNYREKQRRADRVVADIVSSGGEAMAVRADLTNPMKSARCWRRSRPNGAGSTG